MIKCSNKTWARATAACKKYRDYSKSYLWAIGHAAGVRDAGKSLQPMRKRLQAALKKASAQNEALAKQIGETRIKELQYWRTEKELRMKYDRHAAMMESRTPANNGGFAR